ncbi:efflux RND transporter periplasmic adaptor subunit [Ferrimonas pelagia]|uniref:Uncharacterized protein n=1 Tax=Ferrimonas pelagia TaxID=1177826 RepID=A0ABP9F9C4_9GAMM
MNTLKLSPVAAALLTLSMAANPALATDDHAHSHTQSQTTATAGSALVQTESAAEHVGHDHAAHDEHGVDAHSGHDDHADDTHSAHDDDHDDHDDEPHDDHADADPHAGHGHGDDEEEPELRFSAEQRAMAGIALDSVIKTEFRFDGRAPAQIVVNPALTQQISLPITVRVSERHVNAGATVTAGQPLFTLLSSDIARLQGDYLLAVAEWQRVSELGRQAISGSRFQQARIDVQTRKLDLVAIGMSEAQIIALADPKTELGSFVYQAPIGGIVQQDDLVLGLNIDANAPLMQLADESELWIEANVPPSLVDSVELGDTVVVEAGGLRHSAKVIGREHQMDPQTRTESVRLLINNEQHQLHVGEFASAYFVQSAYEGVVLPDSALVRAADGDWAVFVLEGDLFEMVEVEVLQSQRGQNLVAGLEDGQQVVVRGAFFLNSELMKSGFDPHDH